MASVSIREHKGKIIGDDNEGEILTRSDISIIESVEGPLSPYWSTSPTVHSMTTEDVQNKEDSGKRFAELFKEFGDNTTFHGLRYVTNNTYNIFRRFVWTVVVIAMASWLIVNIITSTILMFQYPETSSISLNYVPKVTFPAVTLCNINHFRSNALNASAIETLAKIYGDDSVHNQNGTGIDFSPVDSMFHTPNGSETLETIFNVSHQLENMLFMCKWRHERCSHLNFTRRLTDFGVCYTFNEPAEEKDVLKVQNAGSSYGLFMRLNIEQDLYTYGESSSAGIKVMLHPQREFPLVNEFAISLAPGYESSVAVRKQVVKSLPEPFKSNCTKTTLKDFPFEYSVPACHLECMVRFVVDKCGCRDYRWPVDSPICTVEQHVKCVYHYEDEFVWDSDQCSCPMACTTTIYETKTSYAHWPARYLNKDLQTTFGLSDDYLRNNYLDVYIFMEEIMYMEIEQKEAYILEHYLSDIGGYMGLLCGMSLITLIEWADFTIITLYNKFC